MKKIKILPSVLMLVLCIGVLAVGVFAITPTENKIIGSISIGAVPEAISVQMLIDGKAQGEPVTLRSGTTWTLGDISFNTTNINSMDEIQERRITFRVHNLSDKPLGVYFLQGTLPTEDSVIDVPDSDVDINVYKGIARGSNIRTSAEIFDKTVTTDKIADVAFTPYMFLGANDDKDETNTVYDTVDMTMTFSPYALYPEKKESETFTFVLNIEPYKPNIKTADIKEATFGAMTSSDYATEDYDYTSEISSNTVFYDSLLKLPTDLSSLPAGAFYNNEYIEHVIVPSNVKRLCAKFLRGYHSGAGDDVEITAFGTFDCPNLKTVGWCTQITSWDYSDYVYGLDVLGVIDNSTHESDNTSVVLSINAPVIAGGVEYANPFMYCNGLTRVEMTSNVTKIESYAFAQCHRLNYIFITNSVVTIEGDYLRPFAGCNALTKIFVEGGVKEGFVEDWNKNSSKEIEIVVFEMAE